MRYVSVLLFSLFCILGVPAYGGPAGPSTVPKVDFSTLPATATVAKSDGSGKPHPVVARLLPEQQSVQPGVPFRIGIHLTMLPEWHTYWRSPGGVGKKTEISWSLPEKSTQKPYTFPIPNRYFDGQTISYGYDDQVLLFTEVTLPSDTPLGPIDVGASARWLVCKTSCILGQAKLTLPVTVSNESISPSPYQPLFEHFEKQHPTAIESISEFKVTQSLSVSSLLSEEAFQYALHIQPTNGASLKYNVEKDKGTWPLFTPIVEGTFDLLFQDDGIQPKLELKQAPEGGVFVVMSAEAFEIYDDEPLPAGEKIGGLLQLEANGKKIQTEIVLDVPWTAPGKTPEPVSSDLVSQANASPALALTPQTKTNDAPAQNASSEATSEPKTESDNYWAMLFFAFLGGLILNAMPCVLPVLTFKIYTLIEQKDQKAAKRQLSGLVYSAGVILSFIAFGLVVIFSQELIGHDVSWGFQNQSATFTIALGTICFLFGLSLFGVFEVPAFGASEMDRASDKEGLLGYFLTGVFTTLIATPCSAPFLGTGMAFAFKLPPIEVLLFFSVAGLGLAFPFLLIAFIPAASKILPSPGAWMERFKQIMGFTLVGTTVWLINGLYPLVGADGVIGYLAFLVIVGFGAWLFGVYGGATQTSGRQLGVFIGVVVLYLVTAIGIPPVKGFLIFDTTSTDEEETFKKDQLVFQWMAGTQMIQQGKSATLPVSDIPKGTEEISVKIMTDLDFSEKIPWQTFSETNIDDLVGSDYTIFIDFTAEWCASCKVNEKTILETEVVRNAMKEHKVWPMKADNTKHNPMINRWLQHFESAGVPLYLVIPAKRKVGFENYSSNVLNLGEIITTSEVIEAIKKSKG